ncbi:hypothetical protein [Halalkalibacter sp. APA_J-10(15)]|nr:hypothetical protein [Halalkalibacter sp. APA_J-10(15)]
MADLDYSSFALTLECFDQMETDKELRRMDETEYINRLLKAWVKF